MRNVDMLLYRKSNQYCELGRLDEARALIQRSEAPYLQYLIESKVALKQGRKRQACELAKNIDRFSIQDKRVLGDYYALLGLVNDSSEYMKTASKYYEVATVQ